ncbi:MAG: TIGR02300 family protein [Thermoanaerobaculia bacterium]|nr:MAG: TIGR02300 family protein [Thermoanaerobaculia bacterium]MBZ0101281.1 FYDLN acid domain-containing protein [Thermoanaerobaculia bacterium]
MPDLGNKYECFSCGVRFYDLGKPAPICPKCGANQKDARKQEAAAESTVRRKRREEVVRIPDEEEVSGGAAPADDDFGDDEMERPEGVEDDEPVEDLDEED